MEDKMTIYGALVRLFFSLNSNQIYMECFFKKIQKKKSLTFFLNNQGNEAKVDYFAVFDGHGGADSASFANKNLHKYVLAELKKRK